MIAQTRKLETARPEGLNKQLQAALLILEALDTSTLDFEETCALEGALARISDLLGKPKVEPIPLEEREQILQRLDLLEAA